jgi:orotidine-5'-phosphate decarboxylase
LAPNHFFLVPGVGAQGGTLDEVVQFGWAKDCGLLINSSRGILYASSNLDFAEAARKESLLLQQEMETILNKKGLVN